MVRRGLKKCCFTTVVLLAILAIIIVTLALTIFKPKDPQITLEPVNLENIQFNTTDIKLSMLVTIHNPNYGSFEYISMNGYVNYHGSTVAEVPLTHKKIPARAKVTMATSMDLSIVKLISNPSFWDDIASDSMNFTSTATLPGKVRMAKIFKFHATVYTNCYILFRILSRAVDSKCITRIKL
ncbi:uncharacterized protein LOC115682308 [Syzygium oleosum]|uniref:uncharacterized protein LOC115682308 n=1 Tax=Syzygium oleosum TaxID=219896 RepID=UPI0011D22059|nr:uncharacterized protein LOC115682308 [Syzygium oleosum]